MPELPEVETVRRGLAAALPGTTIVAATAAPHPRFGTAGTLTGHTLTGVTRRGKHLLVHAGPADLAVHLGMSGVVRVWPQVTPPAQQGERWRWVLDTGDVVTGADPRGFGHALVVPAGRHTDVPGLSTLGPEATDLPAVQDALARQATGRRSPIKAILLNQQVLAGLGNIYVDEALWAACIHPQARHLATRDTDRLAPAVVTALEDGLAGGGTTLRDYRTATGGTGDHQSRLRCYGRAGQPCHRCQQPLVKTRVAGRGTTFCARCQPAGGH